MEENFIFKEALYEKSKRLIFLGSSAFGSGL